MRQRLSVLFILGTLFFSKAAFATTTVTVDRIRWKKSTFGWLDHPDYPEWNDAELWTGHRKRTYIARHWAPEPAAVRTIILLMAGQQGASGASGCSNCLTGQDDAWDEDWKKGEMSKKAHINPRSLSGQLISGGHFSAKNTFLGIVFNSAFNWENTSASKKKAERAFTNWLLKHGDPAAVQRIILLGSSRGGMLAMRMAKQIKQEEHWADVPLFVGLLDAVPNTLQNELATKGQPTCSNPLNSDYYARRADLETFFNGLEKPKIRHIVTGAPVIFKTAVHAFCADELSWYEQSWVDLAHTEIGRCVYSEGAAYEQSLVDAGTTALYEWIIDQL